MPQKSAIERLHWGRDSRTAITVHIQYMYIYAYIHIRKYRNIYIYCVYRHKYIYIFQIISHIYLIYIYSIYCINVCVMVNAKCTRSIHQTRPQPLVNYKTQKREAFNPPIAARLAVITVPTTIFSRHYGIPCPSVLLRPSLIISTANEPRI